MEAADAEQAAPLSARANLRVYAMDGALLGLFMASACLSVTLFEYPTSPLRQLVASDFARRALVGLAMGLTAVGLIYSPWGKRSGAFMNPAMTLCFLRLGKLEPLDALGYVVAQFVGGTLGVSACALLFPAWVSHPAVNYVVTAPGPYGDFRSVARRVGYRFFDADGGDDRQSRAEARAAHGLLCGDPGGSVHHVRSAAVGHELESGAQLRLFGHCPLFSWFLDLSHGAAERHVARRGAAKAARRSPLAAVRKTQSQRNHRLFRTLQLSGPNTE